MLNYHATGPTPAGRFLVTYRTPGCNVLTVACDCSTAVQAAGEAKRLNDAELAYQAGVRRERELCGLPGIYLGSEAA